MRYAYRSNLPFPIGPVASADLMDERIYDDSFNVTELGEKIEDILQEGKNVNGKLKDMRDENGSDATNKSLYGRDEVISALGENLPVIERTLESDSSEDVFCRHYQFLRGGRFELSVTSRGRMGRTEVDREYESRWDKISATHLDAIRTMEIEYDNKTL